MKYTNYLLLHSRKLLQHAMKMSRSGALEVNKAAKKHVTVAFIRILILNLSLYSTEARRREENIQKDTVGG